MNARNFILINIVLIIIKYKVFTIINNDQEWVVLIEYTKTKLAFQKIYIFDGITVNL
jgi:hypothetical protein